MMNFSEEMKEQDGQWLPIVDYSMRNNLSISTIRRSIKSKKLLYKIVGGKYFIYGENPSFKESEEMISSSGKNVNFHTQDGFNLNLNHLYRELEELKKELRKVKEENNELKMLVDLYETSSSKNF